MLKNMQTGKFFHVPGVVEGGCSRTVANVSLTRWALHHSRRRRRSERRRRRKKPTNASHLAQGARTHTVRRKKEEEETRGLLSRPKK